MIYGVTWRQFLGNLYRELKKDNVFNGAAALGFFLTLALFPGLVFLMAVIPYRPIDRVDMALNDFLQQALPDGAAETVTGAVDQVSGERSGRPLSLSLSLLFMLGAASSGMHAIMQQMNIAFDVPEGRPILRARATAVALTVMFFGLVLGSFSLIVFGGEVQDWIGSRYGFSDTLLNFFVVFRWVVIVFSLMLAFALIYFLAPNCERDFALVSPGSVTATVLVIVASLGFVLYTSNFGEFSETYGNVGAMVVLMFWLYLVGFVILLGAEINVAVNECRKSDDARRDKQGRDEKSRDAPRSVTAVPPGA
jgi:membrane protein